MFIPSGEQRFDGDAEFQGTPLNEAAWITYYLKKRHLMGELRVEIYDASDKLITAFPGGKRRGVNRVEWLMRMKPPRTPAGANIIRVPGSFFGPRVQDGEYTVKLIKGKDTFTSKVKLMPDPRATYTAEDRKAQHVTVTRLYGMMGELTYLHDRVMDARTQTLARLDKLPAKDGARRQVQAFADDLQKQRGMLSAQREGWLTGEEQLRERLGALYGAVNNYDGRPTNSMLDNLKLMEKELADAATRIDGLMTKSLPTVNAALTKAKLEGVTALTRDAWEAKQSSGGVAKASGEEALVEND